MENINESFILTKETLDKLMDSLQEQGVSDEKLRRARQKLKSFYYGLPEKKLVTAEVLRKWREDMLESGYSPRTIESHITVVNKLLRVAGHPELCFTQGQKVDLTGRVFGRLTVLEKSRKDRANYSGVFWRCKCTCGKELDVATNKLLNGSYQSCGCLKLEKLHNANGYIDNTCLKMVLSDTVRSDNTSGYPGVYRKKDKWAARIQYKGKIYALGCYKTIEEAIQARKEAETWVRDDAERLLNELGRKKEAV